LTVGSRVARRYAAALFRAALDRGQVPQVFEELKRLRELIDSLPELAEALFSPTIRRPDKHRVIDRLFAESASPLVLSFLHLCVEKHRPEVIVEVLEPYAELRDEHENVARATIVCAVELTEEHKQRLVAALERYTGKQLVVQFRVDPGVVGGVLVVVGDTVLDGTLRQALEQMRQRLLAAPVTVL